MSRLEGTPEVAARSSLGPREVTDKPNLYKWWHYLLSNSFPVLDPRGGYSREKM